MAVYTIGYLLHHIRKEKHISLQDMCAGLCNVSMASRIERNERVPSRKLIEALFSRLGESAPGNMIPMTKADFEMRNLEYRIIAEVADGNYEVAHLLEAYRNKKERFTPLEKQFYDFYYAIYIDRDEKHPRESLDMLVSALHISMPEYILYAPIQKKLLTRIEIGILNTIAVTSYYELDKKGNAFSLMQFLKDFQKTAS